jgi:hypothetical protein
VKKIKLLVACWFLLVICSSKNYLQKVNKGVRSTLKKQILTIGAATSGEQQ